MTSLSPDTDYHVRTYAINAKGTVDFTEDPTGLGGKTTYFVRAYAVSSVGTGYGNQLQFETLAGKPHVATEATDTITVNSAVSHGHVRSTGGYEVTLRGICWGPDSDPDDSNGTCTVEDGGTGEYTVPLNGLTAGTTYHVRAYAENSEGTNYGVDQSFTTISQDPPTVTTGTV